jgi:uncharacterized protein (TIGR00369 family)
MTFEEDGDEVISRWVPTAHFQGYGNVLHGGIQSALMDEIAGWLVLVKLKTAGVTSKLEVRYRKPVLVDGGQVTLKARLKEMKKNIAVVDVDLYDSSDVLCSHGEIYYFTLSEKDAREKLRYPGLESFYA